MGEFAELCGPFSGVLWSLRDELTKAIYSWHYGRAGPMEPMEAHSCSACVQSAAIRKVCCRAAGRVGCAGVAPQAQSAAG
jgi:hypothetical protein